MLVLTGSAGGRVGLPELVCRYEISSILQSDMRIPRYVVWPARPSSKIKGSVRARRASLMI